MLPTYTLAELAAAVPDTTVHGDGSIVVDRFVAPNAMRGPGDLALVMEARVADALAAAPQLPIRAAVVASPFAEAKHPLLDRLDAALITARPRVALSYLTQAFSVLPETDPGIHERSFVHETAQVDASASIGPNSYIGPGCIIGPNTVIMPQVTILDHATVGADCFFYPGVRIGPRTQIGDRVIMQPNACIAADGFSFVTAATGNFEEARTGRMVSVEVRNDPQLRIDSIGSVVIEDDVEIGAGTCVDRGTLGECRIKKGTKLDNLIQIGHNNTIGENCLIAAETVMAGSCTVGNGVVIGGHVSIADNTRINDGAVILGGAGLMGEIDSGSVQFGAPSVDARTAFKNIANIRQIGKMRQRLNQLEKQVAALTTAAAAEDSAWPACPPPPAQDLPAPPIPSADQADEKSDSVGLANNGGSSRTALPPISE